MVIKGFELGHNGQSKEIKFYKDSKENEKQIRYFNNLFDKNLQLYNCNRYGEYAYFGAFRCSKSFSQQLAVFLICLHYPKTKAVYIRETYDELKDSVIKQFNDDFEYLGAYEYRISDRVAKFKNGSELRFRTFEKDTGILSTEYDVIAVCQVEDIPHELFLQLIGRASGRILGQKGIILVEGNPASGWVKDRYRDQSIEMLEQKGIFCIPDGVTPDNPFVTAEYKQWLIDNYPKFWLDRYYYGLWDNREELVFSEFNESKYVIEPISPRDIPKTYVKRNGFDWGWNNPSCILRAFLDYDGRLTIYDEFYQSKTLPENLAEWNNQYGKVLTVADHSMKGLKMPTKDDENKTVWSECEKYGMLLQTCNKEELSNIILTNSLMKQDKFRITKNCVNTLREVKNWKWKRLKLGQDKNMPEEAIDKDNHACDTINYLVADLFGEQAPNPADAEFKKSLQYVVMKHNTKQLAYVNS